MKNLKSIITFMSLMLFSFLTTTATANADCISGCITVLAEKDNGRLFAGKRTFPLGQLQNDQLEIRIEKTGGRAATTFKVYSIDSNGNESTEVITNFVSGNNSDTKTFTLTGLQYKRVYIELKNNSATKRFDYKLRAWSTVNFDVTSWAIQSQGEKEVELKPCAQTVKVRRSSTRRDATGTYVIYQKLSGQSNWTILDSGIIPQGNTDWIEYTLPATGPSPQVRRKIEVSNTDSFGKAIYAEVRTEY